MVRLAKDEVEHMDEGIKKGVPFEDVLASLPADEQEAIRVRSQELIQQELTLRDLRKAMGQTQAAMAAKLGIKQENISRVEQRADMMLSTLNSYLVAMGGRLRLVVEFEERSPVALQGFGLKADGDDEPEAKPRRRQKIAA